MRMSTEEQKTAIRRWIEAWNTKDMDAAVELLAPDYVRHDANLPEVVGPQAQREFLEGVFGAFPDLDLRPDQLIAEDGLVTVRHVVRGTHRGEFLGVPATGRVVTFQAVDIFRLTGNKIVEQWVIIDALGLLQQLGAIPSPG
jgi:steroid delta-isomerase-like uncharacterized protein